jgi:hypothetical protein
VRQFGGSGTHQKRRDGGADAVWVLARAQAGGNEGIERKRKACKTTSLST